MEKYKKRCTRLSGQLSKLDSPKQKTKKQMKLQPKSLKKTLLFHNVVLSELKNKYKQAGVKNKQIVARILSGKNTEEVPFFKGSTPSGWILLQNNAQQ